MSLVNDLKIPTPWNWGTPANGVTMYNDTVKPLDDNIRMVASAVDNLPKPSEQVQANWKTSVSSDPSFIKNKPTIPSKTSDLNNDAGFITKDDVPTKTSELDNNSGFITADNLPSKTSELTNDSGFITKDDVPRYQRHANWDEFSQGEASYIENNPFCARFMVPDYKVTSADISRGYCILPVRIFPVDKMPQATELIWFINFQDLVWQTFDGVGWKSHSMKDVVEKIKIGYCTDSLDWEGRYEPDGGPAPLGEIDNFERVTTRPCLKKPVNIVTCTGSLDATYIQGPSFKIMLKSGSAVQAGDEFGFRGYIRIIHWNGQHGLSSVLNN